MKINRESLDKESVQTLLLQGCLGIALLFPWVFFFALPPLRIGIWFNTEGVALGIASLGTIAAHIMPFLCWNHLNLSDKAAYLSTTDRSRQKNWKDIFKAHFFQANPLLLSTIGLATISILSLPFSYNKHLSWLGHPEQMLGGWFWLSISMILLCYTWIKGQNFNKKHIQAIRISSEFACIVQIALVLFAHPQYTNATGDWVLYHFTAHLGWIGASLLILSISHFGKFSSFPETLLTAK